MGDSPRAGYLTVSSPDLLLSVRRLLFLQHLLEVSIGLAVVGSIASAVLFRALGHAGLVGGGLLTTGVALARALVLAGIRQRTGGQLVALHGSGRWLVVRPWPADPALGPRFDLKPAALPAGPLLWPGLALAAAAVVARLAAPMRPDPGDALPVEALAGLAAALLLLHQAARAALTHEPARSRFRKALPGVLVAIVLAAAVRVAAGGPAPAAWFSLQWPRAWPSLLLGLCTLWIASTALAGARGDRLLLGALAGLIALAAAGGGEASPHVWAAFAVAAALPPRPRYREPQPGPAGLRSGA